MEYLCAYYETLVTGTLANKKAVLHELVDRTLEQHSHRARLQMAHLVTHSPTPPIANQHPTVQLQQAQAVLENAFRVYAQQMDTFTADTSTAFLTVLARREGQGDLDYGSGKRQRQDPVLASSTPRSSTFLDPKVRQVSVLQPSIGVRVTASSSVPNANCNQQPLSLASLSTSQPPTLVLSGSLPAVLKQSRVPQSSPVTRRPAPYRCPFGPPCPTFYRLPALKDHLKMHARAEEPYVCFKCGNGFTTESALRSHQWLQHSTVLFGCIWPGCDYNNLHHSRTRRHVRSRHFGMTGATKEKRQGGILEDTPSVNDYIEVLTGLAEG